MNSEYDYTIKLFIVGNTAVGKTNFMNKFVDDQFQQNHVATVGIDFKTKYVEFDGKKMKVQLWSTAGKEKYKSISKNIMLRSQGLLALYDITNEKTYLDLKQWIQLTKEKYSSYIPIMIIGNKNDLESERVVDKETAISYAEEENAEYIETSCKTGDNILKSIVLITRKIIDFFELNKSYSFTLSTRKYKNKERSCC